MSDLDELKRLAKAARETESVWWSKASMLALMALIINSDAVMWEQADLDAAYIATASPDVVLGLIERIGELENELANAKDERYRHGIEFVPITQLHKKSIECATLKEIIAWVYETANGDLCSWNDRDNAIQAEIEQIAKAAAKGEK